MKAQPIAADYIQPLYINGLNGRMLRAPGKKGTSREILLVYGHHAMLERWWGLVENLQECGTVTMPDLPGFGGMDSFYKIGSKPTLDNYADYLASFVQMRYKRRKVTLIGISFGFLVITRMLQRYPELANKVELVVSIVGFMHRDDFLFPRRRRVWYSRFAKLFSIPPIPLIIRYGWLNKFAIKQIYIRTPAGKRRFIAMAPTDFTRMMDYEVALWQKNDVRTHWSTTSEFLKLDNCGVQVALPVWHVASKADHYFNNHIVAQHMQVVFTEYRQSIMNSPAHTPSIIGTKKELAIMLPPDLKRFLKRH